MKINTNFWCSVHRLIIKTEQIHPKMMNYEDSDPKPLPNSTTNKIVTLIVHIWSQLSLLPHQMAYNCNIVDGRGAITKLALLPNINAVLRVRCSISLLQLMEQMIITLMSYGSMQSTTPISLLLKINAWSKILNHKIKNIVP